MAVPQRTGPKSGNSRHFKAILTDFSCQLTFLCLGQNLLGECLCGKLEHFMGVASTQLFDRRLDRLLVQHPNPVL